MKFRIGQLVVDRMGRESYVSAIDETDCTYPVLTTNGSRYTSDGKYHSDSAGVHDISPAIDKNEVAAETLQALGWTWDGQCWVKPVVSGDVDDHPMKPVFDAAIHQAMHGKGERHGGATVPFLDQPIFHYAKMHGRGFLTGQAAKKLEEAASTRSGTAFETEVLGAIVYAAAAIIHERSTHA